MSFKRILLPVDFSDLSRTCLRWTAAQFPDAEIVFLHVCWEGDEVSPSRGDPHVEAGEELARIAGAFSGEFGHQTRSAIVSGHPSTEICQYAQEGGYDLIVMSTHGRSGIKHMLVGSVAERVVGTSRVPVLTISRVMDSLRPGPAP